MNDRYDAGYGGDPYQLVGYDEYGQPVYRQVPAQQVPQQQPYDPYGQQGAQGGQGGQGAQGGQGYGYDPYAQGGQPQGGPQATPYDPYDTGRQQPVAGYDTAYDTTYDTGRQATYDPYATDTGGGAGTSTGTDAPYDPYGQTAHIPQQARPAAPEETGRRGGPAERTRPQDADSPQPDYRTEQFAFVEEPDGDSEDVIDWLNFTENRTERREEAKRRARGRLIALVVVMALVAVGGVGWLWYAGKLPGLSDSSDTGAKTAAAGAAQKRDVVVVHLHDTAGGDTATALLVDNTTTRQATTVLLPNSLVLTTDDGTTTTLAKSVDDDGSDGTRTALDAVLGTDIEGTWRLDTPYLQNLVDLVGNIEVDTDTDVPDPKAKKGEAPLVRKGEGQTLSGRMAVGYATYRAPGEAQNAQLERFGQVLQGVLRKISSDPQAATVTVQTLAQILDPSLTDKDLGTFLANLADLAKGGDHQTALLPVQADGTLSTEGSSGVVKDVLGGTAKSPDKDAAVSVSVQNATGTKSDTEDARVVLLNGGFTFLDAGTASAARATSEVRYADAAGKENASEVAKTLGLPAGAVKKGEVGANADVTVVLGQDYEPSSS